MAKRVKSTYVEFATRGYINQLINQTFNEDKFKEDYQNNPNRMTPEQIKMNGGIDCLYSSLWDKYIDAKHHSLNVNLLEASTGVIKQIESVIRKLYPDLTLNIHKGEARKYGDRRLTLTTLVIGNPDGEGIEIIPTLDSDNYFKVSIETNKQSISKHCNDDELMIIIDRYNQYLKSGAEISLPISKMYHKYENQYLLEYGNHSIELYDVVMMQLYHTLAKDMNDKFGTTFEYSQKMIDKLWKHDVFGNIQYVGKFYLSDYNDGKHADLRQMYFYKDEKTKLPTFRCYASYGEYSKEQLTELLVALKPYATSNYFAEQSKKAMTEKYNKYDKMGIGYSKRPDYFQDLEYVK